MTVLILLAVALVTSRLAAGIRAQARIAGAHAARNATIAGFARRLLPSSSEQEIAATACGEFAQLFHCNAILATGLPEPRAIASAPDGNRLTPADVAAAALTLKSGEAAGRGTSRSQPAEWVFHAVTSGDDVLAAVGLARDDGRISVDDERLELLRSLLDQMALALERARLEREARQFESVREQDKMRSILLASIGSDLDPVISLMSNAAREQRRKRSSDRDFVTTIEGATAKLKRYLSNLIELAPEAEDQSVETGGLRIDLFARKVSRNGQNVRLTPKEYAILSELAKHPGQVLTHAQLLRAAWGPAHETQAEYLRVAIRALRQKLERDPAHPEVILNEPAVGYRLAV